MRLEVMLSTFNIILTFLILKIVCGQQDFQHGVNKYRRNEELSNTLPPYKPLELKLDPKDENVQLLVPHGPQYLKDTANDVQQIPPEKDPKLELNTPELGLNTNDSFSLKNKKAKISPYRVNYVQEKTAEQWPMGVVPYFIDTNIYDSTTIRRIVKTMGVVESLTCVIFKELVIKPKDDSKDAWLHITNPTQERECVHELSPGVAGETVVVLAFECLHPEEILHTLLHAIGLKDEISHPHRDQYVRILWENIQPKYRNLFRIQFEDASYKLVEYDPMSIMHFHDRAFSANGAATIAPVISGLQIGPTDTLSPLDIMKLNLAFGHECNKRKIGNLLDTCKTALFLKKVGSTAENGENTDDTKNRESDTYEEDHPNGGKSLNGKESNPKDAQNLNHADSQEETQILYQEGNSEEAQQLEEKGDVEKFNVAEDKIKAAKNREAAKNKAAKIKAAVKNKAAKYKEAAKNKAAKIKAAAKNNAAIYKPDKNKASKHLDDKDDPKMILNFKPYGSRQRK